MSYTPVVFFAGETPTAAKWNLLGQNDASFNDGSGIDDGAIGLRQVDSSIWQVGDEKTSYSSVVPAGWLLQDGSEIRRVDYPELFAVIGITNGAGDGENTFNLPDMRDRFSIGVSGTKGVGTTGGEAAHILTTGELAKHTHSQNQHNHGQYPHSHTVGGRGDQGGADGLRFGVATTPKDVFQYSSAVAAANYPATASNNNTGSNQAHNNIPPYRAKYFYIRYI